MRFLYSSAARGVAAHYLILLHPGISASDKDVAAVKASPRAIYDAVLKMRGRGWAGELRRIRTALEILTAKAAP